MVLNAFYFPTTALLVDDQEEFLNSLQLILQGTPRLYESYDTPYAALQRLQEEEKARDILREVITRETDLEMKVDQPLLGVDLGNIHKLVYHPHRFNRISTIVFDYEMPGMDGLKMISHLKSPHIYKVMLTGAADEHVAIEAFNKGLIHRFIRKQNHQTHEIIKHAILEGEHHYFHGLSETIMHALSPRFTKNSGIGRATLAKQLASMCDTHNIVEYYLLDNMGSFLLIDANGKIYSLFVLGNHDLNALADYAESNNAPAEIIKGLKEKTHGLCYYNPAQPALTDISKWQQYICPLKPLCKRSGLYYSIREDSLHIQSEKFIPFAKYSKSSY